MNNVGRSSFGVRQVQKCLFEALTTLKTTMVRVNHDGKEASGAKRIIHVWLCLLAVLVAESERYSVERARRSPIQLPS